MPQWLRAPTALPWDLLLGPALTLGSLQPLVTPAPRNPTPLFFWLLWAPTYMWQTLIKTHTYTHILKKS